MLSLNGTTRICQSGVSPKPWRFQSPHGRGSSPRRRRAARFAGLVLDPNGEFGRIFISTQSPQRYTESTGKKHIQKNILCLKSVDSVYLCGLCVETNSPEFAVKIARPPPCKPKAGRKKTLQSAHSEEPHGQDPPHRTAGSGRQARRKPGIWKWTPSSRASAEPKGFSR